MALRRLLPHRPWLRRNKRSHRKLPNLPMKNTFPYLSQRRGPSRFRRTWTKWRLQSLCASKTWTRPAPSLTSALERAAQWSCQGLCGIDLSWASCSSLGEVSLHWPRRWTFTIWSKRRMGNEENCVPRREKFCKSCRRLFLCTLALDKWMLPLLVAPRPQWFCAGGLPTQPTSCCTTMKLRGAVECPSARFPREDLCGKIATLAKLQVRLWVRTVLSWKNVGRQGPNLPRLPLAGDKI